MDDRTNGSACERQGSRASLEAAAVLATYHLMAERCRHGFAALLLAQELHSPLAADVRLEQTWLGRSLENLLQCRGFGCRSSAPRLFSRNLVDASGSLRSHGKLAV